MNDLEQIHKANDKAVQRATEKAVAEGKFGLHQYAGMSYVNSVWFDTERERNAASLAWSNATPGNRTKLSSPAADARPSSTEPV